MQDYEELKSLGLSLNVLPGESRTPDFIPRKHTIKSYAKQNREAKKRRRNKLHKTH